MSDERLLRVKLINHGRSEIWFESGSKSSPEPRVLATNEVVNVTRRLCEPEVFEAFYKELHQSVGTEASLAGENIDAIATELKLNY